MASSPMVEDLPNSRHFFKVMLNDFRIQLSIPPEFCRKLNGEKWEKAVLTSGKGSWNVEIGRGGGILGFKKGWEEFVENHNVNVGDFVVFEHKGRMNFHVLVFDSSACEKQLSPPPPPPPLHQPDAAGGSSVPGRPHFRATMKRCNCNSRHPYLNIPREFWRSNHIMNNQRRVTLRDPLGRLWAVKLRLQAGRDRLSLAHGWSEFFQSNRLKLGDVCIFELSSASLPSPVPLMDVRTFPV